MKLTVRPAEKEDVYRDIARVPEEHRRTRRGDVAAEGSVCKITVGDKHCYVLLRGLQTGNEAVICLDERKRNELGLALGAEAEFDLCPAGFLGELHWAWQASDPAYRVSAQLAVLSFWLGGIGLVLGVIGLVLGLIGACR